MRETSRRWRCTPNGARCYFPAFCRDGKCSVPDPARCKSSTVSLDTFPDAVAALR